MVSLCVCVCVERGAATPSSGRKEKRRLPGGKLTSGLVKIMDSSAGRARLLFSFVDVGFLFFTSLFFFSTIFLAFRDLFCAAGRRHHSSASGCWRPNECLVADTKYREIFFSFCLFFFRLCREPISERRRIEREREREGVVLALAITASRSAAFQTGRNAFRFFCFFFICLDFLLDCFVGFFLLMILPIRRLPSWWSLFLRRVGGGGPTDWFKNPIFPADPV